MKKYISIIMLLVLCLASCNKKSPDIKGTWLTIGFCQADETDYIPIPDFESTFVHQFTDNGIVLVMFNNASNDKLTAIYKQDGDGVDVLNPTTNEQIEHLQILSVDDNYMETILTNNARTSAMKIKWSRVDKNHSFD